MTTDEPLLLRAICEVPDDDTRRLGYADAIEENAGTVPCSKCQPNYKTENGSGLGWLLAGGNGESYFHVPCTNCGGNDKVNGGILCDTNKGTGRVSDGRAERAELIRVQVELAGLPKGEWEVVGNWNRLSIRWSIPDARGRYGWLPDTYTNKEWARRAAGAYNSGVEKPYHEWVKYDEQLRRREQALLPLCPLWFEVGADKTEWTRGFVSGIVWNSEQFVRHAAAIFAAQPVTEVRLTDKRSYWNGGAYCWFNPNRSMPSGAVLDEAVLPVELFRLSKNREPGHRRFIPSPTRAQADQVLSRLCVSYARTLAHLPPLVTPAARPARVG